MSAPSYRYVVLHELRDAEVEEGCKAYAVELVTDHGRGKDRKELGELFTVLFYSGRPKPSKRWRYSSLGGRTGVMTSHERFSTLAALIKQATRGISEQECVKLAREASKGDPR